MPYGYLADKLSYSVTVKGVGMSIFGWFYSKKQPQSHAACESPAPIEVLANPTPAQPTEAHKAKERVAALTKIWECGGNQHFTMSQGTILWHGGTISTNVEMDDSRALWCTRNENSAAHYDNSAREHSMINGRPPYRLTLTTAHPLKLANFNGVSLLQFTSEHCDYEHDRMKTALRNWCLAHRFDGVLNINRGPDEVVLCRPAHDAVILHAAPL